MTPPDDTPPGPRWPGLPPRIALGFGAALVSLAAAAIASWAALDARTKASALVRHTAAAQLALEEIESALLVADVALEADVAAGSRDRRELLLEASAKVQPALEDLRRLYGEHPRGDPGIAALAADLDLVRAEQARRLAALDAGDLGAARAVVSWNAGREALDRALASLDRIEADEAHAHGGREAAWRRNVVLSNAVFAVAVLLLLALTLVAARLVRDHVRALEADRAERARALAFQQRLMAVVSHDLRNPLAGILAAGWRLERTELPATAAPLARRIVGAGRRMERLIRDLLDWSRLQAGVELPIASRDADLHDVCLRIADEFRDRAGDRIAVEHEGDTGGVFDPDRMEQVVGNLVSNALRCAPRDTRVVVRASGTSADLRLEVRDAGPGIAPDARARLFDAYQQGPVRDGSGVGLGLFIVRALVEAHGGTVELDSAPGETRFVVRLPRSPPSHRSDLEAFAR